MKSEVPLWGECAVAYSTLKIKEATTQKTIAHILTQVSYAAWMSEKKVGALYGFACVRGSASQVGS